MAERREAGGGADVPDGEGVNFPVPAENFVDKRERVCYDVMRVQETAPSCGEMSEWLKEPVLKTGGAQVPVGSNPTLSAKFIKLHPDTRKYPSGRRGSPAKGVGWIKPARGFKSLLPRQRKPWNRNDSRVSSFCCPYCPPAPEANCINRSVESARAPKSPLPVAGRGLKNIWICLAFQGSQVYNGSMAKKGEVL